MSNSNLKIKDWAIDDRPREKLIVKGPQNLSDAELLAIIIGSGIKNKSALEVARSILKQSGNNLEKLGKMSLAELTYHDGIGEAKGVNIMAAIELGRRRKYSGSKEKNKITSSNDVYKLFYPLLIDLPFEEFWVVLLNRANKIIEKIKISQGGIAGTIIDIKIILKYALEKLAVSIILCHNHPSGNKEPSKSDINITQKIKKASEIVDIQLLDHVIVAGDQYYSFADENKIY